MWASWRVRVVPDPSRLPCMPDRSTGTPDIVAPSAGPGLAAAGTFTYPIDGGCPGPNKFDALSKVGDANAAAVAFYSAPSSQIARSRSRSANPQAATITATRIRMPTSTAERTAPVTAPATRNAK